MSAYLPSPSSSSSPRLYVCLSVSTVTNSHIIHFFFFYYPMSKTQKSSARALLTLWASSIRSNPIFKALTILPCLTASTSGLCLRLISRTHPSDWSSCQVNQHLPHPGAYFLADTSSHLLDLTGTRTPLTVGPHATLWEEWTIPSLLMLLFIMKEINLTRSSLRYCPSICSLGGIWIFIVQNCCLKAIWAFIIKGARGYCGG